MRRILTLLGLSVLAGTASAGTIDAGLQAALESWPQHQPVSVLVFLADQVDIDGLSMQLDGQRATLQQRHEFVVTALRARAADTQNDLLDELSRMQLIGLVSDYEAFWVSNVVRVDMQADAVAAIALRDDVATVYLNYPIELIAPVGMRSGAAPRDGRSPEPGVVAVRAPEVWAMGFTGAGVLVANMDTGVQGDHPALASRWAGVADPRYADHPEWAWYDPYLGQNDFPYDSGGHGTHTMGSVCGGPPGDEVGVAPGAYWIASAPIDRGGGIPGTVADAILSFEWMVDPDGNPNTNWDVPAVCSNSWGLTTSHGYPPCDDLFWSYLDACEAAGTVILFSAGNEGTTGLRRPADRATDDYNVCAVAAVDANTPSWPIAGFSSRGPTYCTPDGTAAIKPDIAAPGVDVRSSYPGSSYTTMSGTSMASPHVNGVVALIREACPDLTVQEVKEIIYDTAYDLGPAGEDNDYGWGMIDAYEAVNLALAWCGPSPPRVYDGYYEAPVDTQITIALQASDHDGGPNPIEYIITSLPASGGTLIDAGDLHPINPGSLPHTLYGNGNEVLYTPPGGFWGMDQFTFRATDGGTPPEGGESEEATISILVLFDAPTIATETLPQGYVGHSYGPFQLEAEQGQPDLEWSVITDEYLEVDLGDNFFTETGVAQSWFADDQSWSYTLPFAFPFFGQNYTSVWVCSNGFIDFASSSSSWMNSQSDLIQNVRIAPLWDDLMTNQGGEDDIYIDESVPGQVTIRWQAVNYSYYGPWYPRTIAVTLFDDGRIRFHYGAGNGATQSLSPTIGISAGDGTHYLLSQYDNAGNLEWANSLEQLQPSPLPDGMELTPQGEIVGTPSETGTFEPRIQVMDSLDRFDVKIFTLEINPASMYGDVDRDGVVGIMDLIAVINAWGDCDACLEDVNADGEVGIDDLIAVIDSWS